MKTVHRAADVFGIGRDLPLNYVKRVKVDRPFKETLKQDKHVVVFGSSKQGKSSLRKDAIGEDSSVTVSCLNTMTLKDLHGSILKAIGYRVEISQKKSQTGTNKVIAKFSGEGKVPFLASAKGEANGEEGIPAELKLIHEP